MAEIAASGRQYFLGIGGQQVGPFSESEVVKKIESGEVPPDSLVWYEGLSDWRLATSFAEFKLAFTQNPLVPSTNKSAQSSMPSLTGSVKSKREPRENAYTFAEKNKPIETVFGDEEAIFSHAPFVRFRMQIVIGGLAMVFLGFFLFSYFMSRDQTPVAPAVRRAPAKNKREADLNKGMSEIFLNPVDSLKILSQLIQEDPNDHVGQEAMTVALEYYKRTQQMAEAGRLLLRAKKPQEAAPYFLKDPNAQKEGEAALFEYYSLQKGTPTGKKILLDEINLSIGTIKDTNLAIQRIKTLQQDYPGQSHPYGYYLKTDEQKVTDLFKRLSFYYVQTLLGFMDNEMPQIRLVNRPLVQLKKDKNGRFRIQGFYKGPILLNNDQLDRIFFTFWMVGDQWIISDTNLTEERKKWSNNSRARNLANTVSVPEMLHAMEAIFRSQFPKKALHEPPEAFPSNHPSQNNMV